MKTILSFKTATAILVCLTFFATHSNAQTTIWTNTLGGLFGDDGNWDNGSPGPNGSAAFTRVENYGVVLNSDVQIEKLTQYRGGVSFVGGNSLTLSEIGRFQGGSSSFLDSGTELQADVIYVGSNNGPALFQVESRAVVGTQRFLTIAASSSLEGVVTVTGTGSQLDVGTILFIADGGNGSLNIEDGGNVIAQLTVVGRDSGGIGEATVADEESAFNTEELFVGGYPNSGSPGKGTLNLQSGGDVNVGDDQPATNTGSNLYVSNNGTAATMHARNGSLINNDGETFIGYSAGAIGEVTINDSDWINDGSIRVGFLGDGILNIENGSSVLVPANKAVLVATNTGAVPSTGVLNVDGAGTTLVAGQVWAGTRGEGTMNVTNGGKVTNATGNGFIAGLGGTATVTVNGNGSRWFNSNLYLGRTVSNDGGVGTLIVENQGTVYVGNNTPSMNNALIVSDGGSNGMLAAKNGSIINSRDAYIGYAINKSGVVDLSGSGTQWNVAGDLTVGFLGSGSLFISDNAMVAAQETFVNDLSKIVMDRAQLDVGNNLTNEGLLHFTGGVNQVTGPVSNAAGGDIIVDPTATAIFQDEVGHVGNPILVDGKIFFLDAYFGENAFTGIGNVNFANIFRPYNFATGQILFAGGVNVLMEPGTQTEIDIAGTGDFDNFVVAGTLKLDGGLTINFLNGFQPSAGQQYLIANVIGQTTGQFTGLDEGDMVTQVGTVGLFISYTAGNGNDVALITAVVPEIVVPAQFVVTRGDHVSGDITELADSDNQDVSIRRRNADIQSRTEFEVVSFATSANPSFISITVEGSVFARSTVVQTIQAYNFDSGQFEIVHISDATRFTDSSTTVELIGNLSRFVENGTNVVVARVLYQSANPRQSFTSNTDLFNWGFGD